MTNYPPSDGVILPTCVAWHILELIWNIFNTHTWQIDCILWQFKAPSRNIDTWSCYCTFYILSSQIFLNRNQVVYKYFAQSDSIWLSSIHAHFLHKSTMLTCGNETGEKSSPKGPECGAEPQIPISEHPVASLVLRTPRPYLVKTEGIRCICPNAALCNWKATSLGGLP